ncbi:MAG: c-type cytochrome [Woeseia sp.]
MKRDQKFFDMYSLVIGILAFISLGIFVLAMKMSDLTQGVYTAGTEEYKEAVAARLKPFGQVYMPDDDISAAEMQAAASRPAAEPVATTLTGPQVYNEACIACHGNGIAGAPMLTDAAGWEARLAQGTDTLYDHAINGYQGQAGYMPPKGGRMDLSDEEIRGSVDYMVAEVEDAG